MPRVAVTAGRRNAEVVGAGKQDYGFWMNVIKFPILKSPEDVLNFICTPSEVGCIPAKKILRPVGKQIGIVGCPPTTCNGVALKINVDTALFGLFQQLVMRNERIFVGSGNRLIGRDIGT